MDERNGIPTNVMAMLDSASDWVGRFEAEAFSIGAFCELAETPHKQSPIEMMLQVALQVVARINSIGFSEPVETDVWTAGLTISPQFPIGQFRADFAVFHLSGDGKTQVVVECDGTAFHERSEPERRKEKARDRFMQKKGWKVFRYTGREIMYDPYKVAAEIISYLTDCDDIVTPKDYFA